MSHHSVGIAIHALLTDEDLRIRLAMDPVETLADLNRRGVTLTPEEIDLFRRTDLRLWSWDRNLVGGRTH